MHLRDNDIKSKSMDHMHYPQAALWDLISRKYSYDKIINMLSVIISEDKKSTKRLVQECINAWLENGYLIKK